MDTAAQMHKYHVQDVQSASPEQLIAKLYDLGISSCHRKNQQKVRGVLMELIAALNFEAAPEMTNNLYSLYEFCLMENARENFDTVAEILEGLREAWKEGVLGRKPVEQSLDVAN